MWKGCRHFRDFAAQFRRAISPRDFAARFRRAISPRDFAVREKKPHVKKFNPVQE
jgi:hypothetical protein